MKKLIKSMTIAFSIYSKIPMPRFVWEEEDMEYQMLFFPWIGLVIGLLEYLWMKVAGLLLVQSILFVCVAMAIPILITGGFHLDGFMDTIDALSSYQPKEKKLEILKDPHIGAFSVIGLAVYGLLTFGVLSELEDRRFYAMACGCFAVARALCGLCSMYLPSAKSGGMLNKEKGSGSLVVKIGLSVQLVLFVAGLYGAFAWSVLPMLGMAAVTLVFFVWQSKKAFGGITGDLAGYFVVISEAGMLVGCLLSKWGGL